MESGYLGDKVVKVIKVKVIKVIKVFQITLILNGHPWSQDLIINY